MRLVAHVLQDRRSFDELFKTIVAPHLQIIEFEAVEKIPTDDFFYIVDTGRVNLKCTKRAKSRSNA
jgi:hypothetical protein